MAKILERPADADHTTVDSQQAQALSNYAQQLGRANSYGNSARTNASSDDFAAGGDFQIPALQYNHCQADDKDHPCFPPLAAASDPSRLSLEFLNAEESGDPKAMQAFQGDLSRSLNKAAASGGIDGTVSLIEQIDNQLPTNLQIDLSPANAQAGVKSWDLTFDSSAGQSGTHEVAPPIQFSIIQPAAYHGPGEAVQAKPNDLAKSD